MLFGSAVCCSGTMGARLPEEQTVLRYHSSQEIGDEVNEWKYLQFSRTFDAYYIIIRALTTKIKQNRFTRQFLCFGAHCTIFDWPYPKRSNQHCPISRWVHETLISCHLRYGSHVRVLNIDKMKRLLIAVNVLKEPRSRSSFTQVDVSLGALGFS